MTDDEDEGWLPEDLYLGHSGDGNIRPARPVCQGDIFVGLPHVRAAQEQRPEYWKPKLGFKPSALTMLIAHPCSSRSNSSHRLKDNISLAPVIKCPKAFNPPWAGHYELFPLPDLAGGDDHVADLSAVFPVLGSDLTADRRVACLTEAGLSALLDRLAKNATRLEPAHVPGHFESEAERLFKEFSLWELWVERHETEDGFQEWLDSEWRDQSTRRKSLRLHYEEIEADLGATG